MQTCKCRIQKYDPAVTEAPFTFITLGEFTTVVKEAKDFPEGTGWHIVGAQHYFAFRDACDDKGFSFKFFSTSSEPGYDYDVYCGW